MNLSGIVIGLGAFFIIGILHPVVIKTEYHIGTKAWPLFALLGLVCISGSLFCAHHTLAALLAVLGFSLLWSIHELFAQEKRVEKGCFPRNPGKRLK